MFPTPSFIIEGGLDVKELPTTIKVKIFHLFLTEMILPAERTCGYSMPSAAWPTKGIKGPKTPKTKTKER